MKHIFSLFVLITALGLTQQVLVVEPGPIKATGVINEEYGFDASNWDNAPANMFSFTLTERIFPEL